MKNTIYDLIQQQKNASFDQILESLQGQVESKYQLNSYLKELIGEQKIAKFGNSYMDLEQFPTVQGFSNYNINGGAWLSNENEANSFGVSFTPKETSLTINNKKSGFFSGAVTAKKIVLPNFDGSGSSEFAYILSCTPSADFKVIASFDTNKKIWNVLNSELAFDFDNTKIDFLPANVPHGTISVFNFNHKTNNYTYEENLGHYTDYGIESKIVELLGEIKQAPTPSETILSNSTVKLNLDKPFYTIDSIYTKDVDDAIWFEKTSSGYKLYVAIADASSYVHPNTPEDLHAKKEGTSFYLPHKTIHMLNKKLAEDYCSLNVGKPRQAMVVEMDLDHEGKTVSHKYYQANILVDSRLNYDDVDNLLSNTPTENCLVNENNEVVNYNEASYFKQQIILTSLKSLHELAQKNQESIRNNYFRGPNLEIELNEKGKIDYLYEQPVTTPSQKMVETGMLKANISVAEVMVKTHPEFGMFRNQLTPEKVDAPKPAFYDFANQGHWGLQTPFYTHFTSPIRRYCDLMVHRLLKSIQNNEISSYSKEELDEISIQINQQQYKSKQCELKSRKLLIAQYMEKLIHSGQLDNHWKITDYSSSALLLRNEQFLEVYVPLFTLGNSFQKTFKTNCEAQDLFNPDNKLAGLEALNKEWKVDISYPDFRWDGDNKDKTVRIFPKVKKTFKMN